MRTPRTNPRAKRQPAKAARQQRKAECRVLAPRRLSTEVWV